MILCSSCKTEYLAIPVIPICRYCGEWLIIPASEVDLLEQEEEETELVDSQLECQSLGVNDRN